MGEKDDKTKKKRKKRKSLITWISTIGTVVTVTPYIVQLFLGLVFICTIGGVIGGFIGRTHELEEGETATTIDCPCGCVWISNSWNGGSLSAVVDTSTGTTTSGEALDSLKYLGTAKLTYYTKADNDDGAGNFNTTATSTGAEATQGITCAMTKEMMNGFGVKYGDWVYIEQVGVRQIQDLCGTQGKLDIYIDAIGSQPEIEKLSGSELKVYFIQNGTIQKGSQAGITKPTVTQSTTAVPDYGHSTGSLTDTSVKLPTFKYGAKSENVINAFIAGSVVSYELYNVYPSVMIGQKIQESGYSTTSKIPNNFYGIKADASWTGKKGQYATTEYVNGKKVNTMAWFREYDTFDEGVLAHGEFLAQNKRYAKALKATSGAAQIQAIKDAGYATDINYVKNVTNVMKANQLEWFDNIANAKAYMKQKGIYDKYEQLVAKVKGGSALNGNIGNLGQGIGVDTPSGIVGDTGTSGGVVNIGNGYYGRWLCKCVAPCKDCRCHDHDIPGTIPGQEGDGNGAQQGTSDGTFPQAVEGQASGLFGTTADLKRYIESMNASNCPIGTANLEGLKEDLRDLIKYLGKPPVKHTVYKTDKYVGSDGWGFVRYSQSSRSGEPYIWNGYTGASATFNSSSCGLYSTAMVLSTLEKKWVNPAEVAIAMQTYRIRTGKSVQMTQMTGSLGAAYGDGIVALFKEVGYRAEMDKSKLVKSKLDACVDAGGCVIMVVKGPLFGGAEGHFVVVRGKDPAGLYLMGDSVNSTDVALSYDKLNGAFKHSAIYVYPKTKVVSPGTGSGNAGSSGVSGDIGSTAEGQLRSNVVAEAKKYVGTPYVWGGSSPSSGFDCSGLMQWSYKQNGMSIPRTSAQQYSGAPIRFTDSSKLKPGDLMFFCSSSSSNVSHVGMYVGNGEMVHAPETGQNVKVVKVIGNSYWSKITVGYGRYIKD